MQPMSNSLNTWFGAIYVINLKSRVDRRLEMKAQLQRIGLDLELPPIVLFEAVRPDVAAGFPSVGARGCFMSHLAVLRDARARGLTSLLILEDDLNFCEGFASKFAAAASRLDGTDWGMFYGSYCLSEPLQHSDLPCVKADPLRLIGTSAFLGIKGKHLDALIQYLEAMLARPPGDVHGGPMHVDGAYCWFRQSHPEVPTWLASTALGYQRSSKTDVHELRWYDRTSWSARLVSALRRLKNRLRH